jgi:hypothetical protein
MEIYALLFEMQKSNKCVGVLFVDFLTVSFSVYILKKNLSKKYIQYTSSTIYIQYKDSIKKGFLKEWFLLLQLPIIDQHIYNALTLSVFNLQESMTNCRFYIQYQAKSSIYTKQI